MIQVGLHFFTKLTLYRDTIYQIPTQQVSASCFNVVCRVTMLACDLVIIVNCSQQDHIGDWEL